MDRKEIPLEIWREIFQFLDWKDIYTIRRVNKAWNALGCEERLIDSRIFIRKCTILFLISLFFSILIFSLDSKGKSLDSILETIQNTPTLHYLDLSSNLTNSTFLRYSN